jgi:hypothetical protein
MPTSPVWLNGPKQSAFSLSTYVGRDWGEGVGGGGGGRNKGHLQGHAPY